MSEQVDLIDALKAISEGLQDAKIPLADRLWTVADIADYIQLSEFTVSRRVVNQPSFPTPVALSSRRWFAGEVISWAKKNRSTLPRSRSNKNSLRQIHANK